MSSHRFAFQAAGPSGSGANLYSGLGAGDMAHSTSVPAQPAEPEVEDAADKPDDKAKGALSCPAS